MNQKHKPRPIASFSEDDFDLNTLKSKRAKQKNAHYEALRNDYIILAIRIAMALVAVGIALWLYSLIDNFIAHQQHQRFDRSINTAFLLIK